MTRARSLRFLATAIAAGALAWVSATGAGAATSMNYTGSLADGGSWVADVPSDWNGILLLYSHGYGNLKPADAPDPNTQQALLDRGYALAGSSYDPNGPLWALKSAVGDQFETLQAMEQTVLPSQPKHVIVVGTSMGGLVSALEAEQSNGRIDGALTTCGLVGGGITLHNYQLDQWYTMNELLNTGTPIKVVGFSNPAEAADAGNALTALGNAAQGSAQGRARLALAMAFGNVATWSAQYPMPPSPTAYDQQELEQYQVEFAAPPAPFPPFFTVPFFVETARQQMEVSAGGNPSWTAGVDFARLFASSPYAQEVKALYREAGLDLKKDLANLTANANQTADQSAIDSLRQTSVPTGRLQVPELDMHTISDQLIPVQNENVYAARVRKSGANRLLRQAFVQSVGHCNFTPAELVAGVLAIQQRVESGRWDSLAEPDKLNASAAATGLGDSHFIQYQPAALTGYNEGQLGEQNTHGQQDTRAEQDKQDSEDKQDARGNQDTQGKQETRGH